MLIEEHARQLTVPCCANASGVLCPGLSQQFNQRDDRVGHGAYPDCGECHTEYDDQEWPNLSGVFA